MLKKERQSLILEQLNSSKIVNLNELSSLLSVSYDSIRRDVIELEDKGLLKKVHGGVISNSYLNILGDNRKTILNGADIDIVINKALKLIGNNQTIMMDGGTTNFFLAEQIPKNLKLTVITNSPPLAMVLNDHENIEIILLGGKYFKRYQITMGLEVCQLLEAFNTDIYFMGVNGVDAKQGFTIRNYDESRMKKIMIERSKKVICCVVEEKIGVVENYKVCDVSKVDYLITSLKPSEDVLKGFEDTIIL